MAKKYDYIIIGQGIAGSVLSLKLLQRGKSILVLDTPSNNISSSVAAGIFNPITGRRMVKTWYADQLWQAFTSFYQEQESHLEANFFHYVKHYRPFRSAADSNDFTARSVSGGYEHFITDISTESESSLLNDEHGGIWIDQSGYLNIPVFLASVRERLITQGSYLSKHFDDSEMDLENQKIGDYYFEKLIFCRGWTERDHAIFSELPFKPVKGEILSIQLPQQLPYIVNRGVFVLPKADGKCVVGSTYNHDDLSSTPTTDGKSQLIEKLEDLYSGNYEITGHFAGVRPSSADRKPFVGIHPKFETIGILNGLGTKGVSLAPHFADKLISFIEGNGKIEAEADIRRYY